MNQKKQEDNPLNEQFSRTALLLGKESVAQLAAARVAVFGVGGVGSFAAEALARAGVGAIDLIDNDTVSLSNLNRQLVALHSTIGQAKVEVMRARIGDINPACKAETHCCFFDETTAHQFDFAAYDYVIDAIDTVRSKLLLIKACGEAGTRIISCMGAGNKLDPTRFEAADIYETAVCPLARVMRQELRKMGIAKLRVVYSKEEPATTARPPGSVSFVPSAAGLVLAGEVILTLANQT